ncbi:hypothetical protein [Actinokineospora inagensis]|uniref:hypothetical protein n=1 Tax=Actinokineospora inagensis TaxID=103730 RepID=UPI001FE14D59
MDGEPGAGEAVCGEGVVQALTEGAGGERGRVDPVDRWVRGVRDEQVDRWAPA